MNKEVFGAICTFVGIAVGAGIFGLPYVFSKAGFFTGLLTLILVFFVMLFVTLYLGEILLRTKGRHQLSGLAAKYLGTKGKTIMFVANFLSIIGGLSAFIIGASNSLFALFGYNQILFQILFFVFVAPVVYFNFNIIEEFESLFTPIKVLIVLFLSFLLFNYMDFHNLQGFNFFNFLVPYGVLIFSFTGISSLPVINESLKNKKSLFFVIVFGLIIVLLINLLFVSSVLGSVNSVSDMATVSLSKLGSSIGIFSNLFALFCMTTAFVALGFALKENLTLDYKIKNLPAWLIVVLFPLVLLFFHFSFVKIINLTGAIAIGIILFLILIMHSRSKFLGNRKPEYSLKDNLFFKVLISIVLIVGIVYSLIGVF